MLTISFVHDRVAPLVTEELGKLASRTASGRPKSKLRQRRAADVGHPKLCEHLASVVALMEISRVYLTFEAHLNTALLRRDDTLQLGLT